MHRQYCTLFVLAVCVAATLPSAARAGQGGITQAPVAAAASTVTSQRLKGVPDLDSVEDSVASMINAERASQGLPPLVVTSELARLARSYSKAMVDHHFFDHRDPDGNMVRARVERLGIENWTELGENIARNRGLQDPAQVAVREWMKSEGHRENILDARFKETGIGVWVAPDKTVYFTEIFLTRKH